MIVAINFFLVTFFLRVSTNAIPDPDQLLQDGSLQSATMLFCDDSTMAEEQAHSASCEVLMESLYDLEVSRTDQIFSSAPFEKMDDDQNRTNWLQMQKHREENGSGKRVRRRFRAQADPSEPGAPYSPPFVPGPTMSPEENRLRLQVCDALIRLPGVRLRCCSTLWITCPEYGPDNEGSIDTMGGGGGGVGAVEGLIPPTDSILKVVAGKLWNALSNFISGSSS